jgi:hypothetical protein
MAKYYMFRGTTGTAMMVTDDKSGAKLPKHPVGKWVFMKEAKLTLGTKKLGPPPEEVIAAIEKDGYYKISGTMTVKNKAAPKPGKR